MPAVPPSKEWMSAPRATSQYLDGVISFLLFAKYNSSDDWYCCPCVKCHNLHGKKTIQEVSEHLMCDGIDQSYTMWIFHGEPLPSSSVDVRSPENRDDYIEAPENHDDYVEDHIAYMELRDNLEALADRLDDEVRARVELEERFNAFVAEQRMAQESQMRFTNDSTTSQEAMPSSSNQSPVCLEKSPKRDFCELTSIGGRVVASGMVLRDHGKTNSSYVHRVLVRKIHDMNAEVFGQDGTTFADLSAGDIIEYPKALTHASV